MASEKQKIKQGSTTDKGKDSGNIQTYFLNDIIGRRVVARGKKIGKLMDFIVKENGPLPIVSHIYVSRPWGYAPLMIPWERVGSITDKEITVDCDDPNVFAEEPPESAVLLKDFIIDKKVLDVTDRDVEVVFDVKLLLKDNKMYVSTVDFSRSRLLHRMHLGFLSGLFYDPEDEKHTVSWRHIQPLENIGSLKGVVKLDVMKERLSDLPPVDVADVLEIMDGKHRTNFFQELDAQRASDVLEEMVPNVQRELISALPRERVVELLNIMTPGQAADVLSVLPAPEKEVFLILLGKIDEVDTRKIRAILEQHNENILNYSTRGYITVAPDETTSEVQEKYRVIAKGKDVVMYLYVVDEQEKLLGVIDIKELLDAPPMSKLSEIMTCRVINLNEKSTLKDASLIFSRYNFRAIPVVNDSGKIIGVVPYRDVMNLDHIFFD